MLNHKFSKGPFCSSADRDVANKSYRINPYPANVDDMASSYQC